MPVSLGCSFRPLLRGRGTAQRAIPTIALNTYESPATGRLKSLPYSALVGVDDCFDFGNAVGREAALLRVFPDQLLVRRYIHTINLIAGDVALDPLDFRPELIQNRTRFLGN